MPVLADFHWLRLQQNTFQMRHARLMYRILEKTYRRRVLLLIVVRVMVVVDIVVAALDRLQSLCDLFEYAFGLLEQKFKLGHFCLFRLLVAVRDRRPLAWHQRPGYFYLQDGDAPQLPEYGLAKQKAIFNILNASFFLK